MDSDTSLLPLIFIRYFDFFSTYVYFRHCLFHSTQFHCIIPEFRDQICLSGCPFNRERPSFPVKMHGCKATAPAIFIILGLTVILIMCIIAIRSAIDSYDKFFRIFQKILSEQLFLHRNDAPCFYKHRNTVNAAEHPHYFLTFIDQSGKEIVVTAFRYPRFYFSLI